MNKSEMLENLIAYYTDGNKAKFASMLGIKAQNISAWIARNTFDAELIYAKCRGVSADWLLSGEGDMLGNEKTNITKVEANGEKSGASQSGDVYLDNSQSGNAVQIELLEKLLAEKDKQLAEKDLRIRDKDELIQFLKGGKQL